MAARSMGPLPYPPLGMAAGLRWGQALARRWRGPVKLQGVGCSRLHSNPRPLKLELELPCPPAHPSHSPQGRGAGAGAGRGALAAPRTGDMSMGSSGRASRSSPRAPPSPSSS